MEEPLLFPGLFILVIDLDFSTITDYEDSLI